MNARILDENLRLLLTRAWQPIVPDAEFRARLEDLFVAHAARRARLRRVGPPLILLSAAAAALWLFVAGPFAPGLAPRSEGLEGILASGAAATRAWDDAGSPGDGAWQAHALDGVARLLPEGERFEAATPAQAGARVEFAPLGSIDLLAGSLASFGGRAGAALDASGARGVEIGLERGGCVLELGPGSEPWSVSAKRGMLELEHGRLRVAHEPPQGFLRPLDPSGAPGAPVLAEALAAAHPDEPWLRARLHAGRASARATHGALVQAMEPGDEVFLGLGTLYLTGLDPLETASARSTPEALPVEGGGAAEPQAEAPAQLTGRVHHQGAPVADFRVGLLRSVDLPAVAEPEFRELSGTAGEFAISGLAGGEYEVFVQAPGFAVWRGAGVLIGDGAPVTVDCELVRGATVRGIVIDAARGLPLAGAVVLSEVDAPAQVLSLDEADLPPEVEVRTKSGADGGFELKNVAPGPQLLRVRHPEFAPQWVDVETLADGELRAGLEVALRPGGSVVGQVLDNRGQPVVGGVLILSPADASIARQRLSFLFAATDADGRYEWHALAPGRYVVLYFGNEQAAESGRPLDMVFVALKGDETVRADFGAGFDTVLARGHLRDAAGAPVAERSLSLLRVVEGELREEEMRATTSDAQGRWEIANLLPGTYEFYLSGRTPVEVTYQGTVEIPGTSAVFERDLVVSGGVLAGRVLASETDEPLEGFVLLELELAGGGTRFMAKGMAERTTGFSLENLPQGSYRVTAFSLAPGHAYERRSGVWLEGGGRVSFDMALGLGRQARLVVTDDTGAAVEEAEVELVDSENIGLLLDSSATGADGSLVLPGLKLEPLLVRVRAAGFQPAEQRVDVAALAEGGAIRVTLAAAR